jgi:predicted transcriptional regulator
MKIQELVTACGFEFVVEPASDDREVKGAYCCDLLSWVIGRAEDTDALVTVMANQNVIAVAVMADLPCVILSEGVRLDEKTLEKAKENEIAVVSSKLSTYQTALMIGKVLS